MPSYPDLEAMAAGYTAAWNSGDPQQVAAHYAEDGGITINAGNPHAGRTAVAAMAAAFFSAFPDLKVRCDAIREGANGHALYAWTLDGHHAETGNRVTLPGWEEWELDAAFTIRASRGWFDAADEARQIAGK
jgi:uncharacterized protein (TIGR02246 family)